MYKIERDTHVYIYDCIQERVLSQFDDYNDLLWFLALEVRGSLDGYRKQPYKTEYLNEINMGNDCITWWAPKYMMGEWIGYICHSYTRRYMFLDAYNRLLDPRRDYARILELAKSDAMNPRPWHFNYWGVEAKYLPEFRRGPVPGTGVRNYRSRIRHPQMMNEKRQNSDPETMQFVRPSRRVNNLPNPWMDEDWRPYYKSWKDCTKRPHQWKEKPCRDDSAGFIFFTGRYLAHVLLKNHYETDIQLHL